jgi:hypothetical protein
MFQTMTLPEGTYTLKLNSVSTYNLVGPVFIVAAAGTALPDATNVAVNSLGYGLLTDAAFIFTLKTSTEVSIGFGASMYTSTADNGEFWMLKGDQLFAE